MSLTFALLLAALPVRETPKPADPISDKLRFEIALAQRNYMVLKEQLDQIAAHVAEKTKEAEAACAKVNKKWSKESFSCEAKQ